MRNSGSRNERQRLEQYLFNNNEFAGVTSIYGGEFVLPKQVGSMKPCLINQCSCSYFFDTKPLFFVSGFIYGDYWVLRCV